MHRTIFNQSIIAACESGSLGLALQSKSAAVIYMNADLNDLTGEGFKGLCRKKPIFIHLDLLRGLNGSKEGLHFLKKTINPFGVVSTKSNVIRAAKKEGFFAIQRIFLIDTQSFNNSLDAIAENKPDAIEIMPAIAPSIVKKYREKVQAPIILGGLISDSAQIAEAFRQGADAVSLSQSRLWNYPAAE